eukprot:4521601-Pleurochrysis_carterae.AAC.1
MGLEDALMADNALTKNVGFVNLMLDISYLGVANSPDGLPGLYDQVPRMLTVVPWDNIQIRLSGYL